MAGWDELKSHGKEWRWDPSESSPSHPRKTCKGHPKLGAKPYLWFLHFLPDFHCNPRVLYALGIEGTSLAGMFPKYFFCLNTSQNVKLLVTQSCPTLCDPISCSLPGFSVHGISQARSLEWVAISFSRGFSWPRDQTGSPALQADSLPSEPPGKTKHFLSYTFQNVKVNHLLEDWNWRVRKRSKWEGIYVYTELIHCVVQEKPVQTRKVSMLRFLKNHLELHTHRHTHLHKCKIQTRSIV